MQQLKTTSGRVQSTYQVVPIDDLTGGVDLRHTPSLLKPHRARTIRNFSLSEPGALEVAYGYTQHSTTSLGANRCQGGERVYLSSNVFTLVAYEGGVYKPSDTNGAWGSAVYSSIASTVQAFFPYDRDLVMVLDGTNRPRKSDNDGAGSSWTLVGITGPSSACTPSSLSTATAGSFISGSEYEFTYAYVDDKTGEISNEVTTVSTLTMGSTGAVKVLCSKSTDAQVDTIYVYARNKTAGDSVRRRAGSVAQSTAANSTVTIASTAWTANAEAPTDHDVPLAFAFGVKWKNRWWMKHPTIGNRLHFSELFLSAFPALYYVDIPFERGDEIKAIIAQGDTLVIFGGTKPYLIIGQTSLDFEVKPSLGVAGAFGPRSVAAIENGILHANPQGVHIFDGATDRVLTFDIDPAWRDLVAHASNAEMENVALVYDEITKELRIAMPRVYPTGAAGEWILDLNRTRLNEESAWTSTDRQIGGYIAWQGNEPLTGDQGRLFSWHTSNGILNEERTGQSANGSNLTAVYEGPTQTTGRHRSRWIDTMLEFRQSAGVLTAELTVDGVGMGAQTVDIGSGLILYGDSSYLYGDSSRLYGGVDRSYKHLNQPLGAEGYAGKLTLTYVGQSNYRHYTYAHGILPESRPRGL